MVKQFMKEFSLKVNEQIKDNQSNLNLSSSFHEYSVASILLK
jgi:hypothetical protein